MDRWGKPEISDWIGQVFVHVEYVEDEDGAGNAKAELVFDTGAEQFVMFHDQDCCEYVRIEEIVGDLSDLEGSPILSAEKISSDEAPKVDAESFTWTFYKIATIKGSVTLRWLGTSSGYYSEEVDLMKKVRTG